MPFDRPREARLNDVFADRDLSFRQLTERFGRIRRHTIWVLIWTVWFGYFLFLLVFLQQTRLNFLVLTR